MHHLPIETTSSPTVLVVSYEGWHVLIHNGQWATRGRSNILQRAGPGTVDYDVIQEFLETFVELILRVRQLRQRNDISVSRSQLRVN